MVAAWNVATSLDDGLQALHFALDVISTPGHVPLVDPASEGDSVAVFPAIRRQVVPRRHLHGIGCLEAGFDPDWNQFSNVTIRIDAVYRASPACATPPKWTPSGNPA